MSNRESEIRGNWNQLLSCSQIPHKASYLSNACGFISAGVPFIYSVGVVRKVLKKIPKLNKAYPFTPEYRIIALVPRPCKQELFGHFDNRQNLLIIFFYVYNFTKFPTRLHCLTENSIWHCSKGLV